MESEVLVPADTELGELLGMHHTLTHRRGWLAVALLITGILLSLPTWVLWLLNAAAGEDPLDHLGPLSGVLAGAAIGMLIAAVFFGAWALRHRGEVYEVHQNGLRVERAGRIRTYDWTEIVNVKPQPVVRGTAFTQWTGGDFRCFIHLADGDKIIVTGLTYAARELVASIETSTGR